MLEGKKALSNFLDGLELRDEPGKTAGPKRIFPLSGVTYEEVQKTVGCMQAISGVAWCLNDSGPLNSNTIGFVTHTPFMPAQEMTIPVGIAGNLTSGACCSFLALLEEVQHRSLARKNIVSSLNDCCGLDSKTISIWRWSRSSDCYVLSLPTDFSVLQPLRYFAQAAKLDLRLDFSMSGGNGKFSVYLSPAEADSFLKIAKHMGKNTLQAAFHSPSTYVKGQIGEVSLVMAALRRLFWKQDDDRRPDLSFSG